MKKARKFYYGDLVAVVDERYQNHMDHHGVVVGTIVHTKDKHISYEIECECGDLLHPKSSDITMILERYVLSEESAIDRNRRRFIADLNLSDAFVTFESHYGLRGLEEVVSAILEFLTPNRKNAVIKKFGLDSKDPSLWTYQAIADEDGVTRQEIHRRVSLGMKKLERMFP